MHSVQRESDAQIGERERKAAYSTGKGIHLPLLEHKHMLIHTPTLPPRHTHPHTSSRSCFRVYQSALAVLSFVVFAIG